MTSVEATSSAADLIAAIRSGLVDEAVGGYEVPPGFE